MEAIETPPRLLSEQKNRRQLRERLRKNYELGLSIRTILSAKQSERFRFSNKRLAVRISGGNFSKFLAQGV